MKNKKKFGIYIFCFAILLLLVGCKQAVEEEITDRSLLDVKERGKLIVAADVPFAVMDFFDESGNIVGIDVDIGREITNELGVALETVDYDWDDLFVAVKSGEVDVAIAAMTITEERSKEMLFSIPYFNDGLVITVRKNEQDILVPQDLKDKRVGAVLESTGEESILNYIDSVVPYKGLEPLEGNPESAIVYDLKMGTIDAFVLDYIAAKDLIKNEPSLKIVGDPFTQEFYGIATRKGNNALMDEINRILREMKRDGTLKEIENKWLR